MSQESGTQYPETKLEYLDTPEKSYAIKEHFEFETKNLMQYPTEKSTNSNSGFLVETGFQIQY